MLLQSSDSQPQQEQPQHDLDLAQLLGTMPTKEADDNKEQVLTLYQNRDGTYQLTPDNVLEPAPPVVVQSKPKKIVQSQTNDMILVPTTSNDGIVSYQLRPAPVQQHILKPVRVSQRPTIIGRKATTSSNAGNKQMNLTSIIRPVMSPGITKTVKLNMRQHQVVLPKTSTHASLLASGIVHRPLQSMGKKLPTLRPKAILPKVAHQPIQLIQDANGLRPLTPITSKMMSKVKEVIKATQPSPRQQKNNHDRVMIDPKTNLKVVYKVIYPEDVANDPAPTPPDSPNKLVPSKVETIGEGEDSTVVETYRPEDLLKVPMSTAMRKRLLANRKVGRPRNTSRTRYLEDTEVAAKKIRKEFGLTSHQMQLVQKDLVDDKRAVMAEQLVDVTSLDDDDNPEVLVKPEGSRTRSGRITKPPPPKDGNLNMNKKPAEPIKEPMDVQIEDRPKKRFVPPDRFRCKVCNKVYLGDRKMGKHMKLYPGHGPKEIVLVPKPTMSSNKPSTTTSVPSSGKKMPEFPIPAIIPMARTQLEELVKNLDAELVLDVVGKKMFDNFSLWQLESKKMSLNEDKAIGKLSKLFDDIEKMLTEVKKVVDNCLTDNNLCSDKKVPNLTPGEYVQSAFTIHEGPWYLEHTKHIPEQYQKLLGIQAPIMSPVSDSMLMHGEDDNSNSMMSLSSDKDHMSSGQGLGAQVVLERNLGAQSLDIDEDTQDCPPGSSKSKQRGHNDSEFEDSKNDSLPDEEDSNLSEISANTHHHHQPSTSSREILNQSVDIDPKKVLEQHGINISSCVEEPEVGPSTCGKKTLNVSTSDLAMEIDALGPFPPQGDPGNATGSMEESFPQSRTRLPSFSSIIGGSPKTDELVSSSASIMVPVSDAPPVVSAIMGDEHMHLASVMGPGSEHGSSVLQSGPPSVDEQYTGSGPPSIQNRRTSGAAPIESVLQHGLQQITSPAPTVHLSTHSSGPPSVDTHHMRSGPPSVAGDQQQQPMTVTSGMDLMHSLPGSGPPSVISSHQSVDPAIMHAQVEQSLVACVSQHTGPSSVASVDPIVSSNPHSVSVSQQISGPPSVDHQGSHIPSGPPSVAGDHQLSGPPSVDPHYSHAMTPVAVEMGPHLPSSPCIDFQPQQGPPSVHQPSGPPSVDMSIHNSIPATPLSDVIGESDKVQSGVGEKRRNSVTNTTLGSVSSIFQQGPVVSATETPTLGENLGTIDSSIVNEATGGQSVAMHPKTSEVEPIKPSSLAEVTNDSKSQDFLRDLDSMLQDAGEFPFTSALSSGTMELKTPEKLLHSIPPSSMIIPKSSGSGALPSSSTTVSGARTNFLGAISNPSEHPSTGTESSAPFDGANILEPGPRTEPGTSQSNFDDTGIMTGGTLTASVVSNAFDNASSGTGKEETDKPAKSGDLTNVNKDDVAATLSSLFDEIKPGTSCTTGTSGSPSTHDENKK